MFNMNFDKIFPVTQDTKYVGEGTIFFACEGAKHSGVSFILLAIEKGAREIVVDSNALLSDAIRQCIEKNKIILTRSKNLQYDLMSACQKVYQNSHKDLFLTAVTGTKGKTSTAFLAAQFFEFQGFSVGMLGSKYNRIMKKKYESFLTTPKIDYIYAFLHECFLQNVTHVVIEVAAQALTMQRILGLTFDQIIFTNFGNEHGEFYTTQEEYFIAKKNLLNYLKPQGVALLNGDDEKVSSLINDIEFKDKNIIMYGQNKTNLVQFCATQLLFYGSSFEVDFGNGERYFFKTVLHGIHMIYNITVALLAVKKKDSFFTENFLQQVQQYLNNEEILNNEFSGVGTRHNLFDDLYVYIDRAHTPESFDVILKNLKSDTSFSITVVFGCGGDRDQKKRPQIAQVCQKWADTIIVTEDNPRNELLVNIMIDIIKGFDSLNNVYMIPVREEAINFALSLNKSKHIVVLLGKGGETFQLRKSEKIYFSEMDCINKYLGGKNKKLYN